MASNLFRDSLHSALYSKFRPSPPKPLVDFIIQYCKNNIPGPLKCAIDIGCGSGQSTVVLGPYFDKVTGFDVSETQIESAVSNRSAPNIEYKVEDCLNLPLPNESVQLVTSSQAIHWFNFEIFYQEVKRLLVPNGVMAAYGYWIPLPQAPDQKKTKKIDQIISDDFHEKTLGKYWNKERLILMNYYKDIPFPFKNVQRFDMVEKSENSLSEYIGYLSSWSAYQKLLKENGEKAEEILKNVEAQLLENLELKNKEETFPLHTDFFLLIGSK